MARPYPPQDKRELTRLIALRDLEIESLAVQLDAERSSTDRRVRLAEKRFGEERARLNRTIELLDRQVRGLQAMVSDLDQSRSFWQSAMLNLWSGYYHLSPEQLREVIEAHAPGPVAEVKEAS